MNPKGARNLVSQTISATTVGTSFLENRLSVPAGEQFPTCDRVAAKKLHSHVRFSHKENPSIEPAVDLVSCDFQQILSSNPVEGCAQPGQDLLL